MFSEFVWSKPEAAGFVPTVPDDCSFGGISTLSGRTCTRGRANRVATLSPKKKSGPTPPAAPSQTEDGMELRRSTRNKVCTWPPRADNVQAPPPRPASATQPPRTGRVSPATEAIPADSTPPTVNTCTGTERNTLPVDANANDTEALADACAVYALEGVELMNKDHSGIPSAIVFKDSWPVGDSIELDAYSTISGQFGLPVLW